MENNYAITGDQMKAIKKVEKAMKECEKLGVHFWDNYGHFCAYNNNVIHCPVPDHTMGIELDIRKISYLKVNNFHPGNADDSLFISFKN